MSKFNGLSGSKIIYNKLLEYGVKDAFLYSGGAIMGLIDQFYKGPIKYYVNSHEQNAGHCATGYARSSNRTGVVITTSGPGLTNCVTPMLDAQNDSTPVIFISGQVPLSAVGMDAFQECNATAITKPITKWSHCVQNVVELPTVMDKAFKVANDGKKGVVHIDLPKCVSASIFDDNKADDISTMIHPPLMERIYESSTVDIEEIAKVINKSERPVFYIGQGCNRYPELLWSCAITSNIPVTTTMHAMGVFPETHDLSLKFLGMHGNPAANYSIQNADTIIALGSRFDDRTTGNIKYYAPKCKNIIHVNIEPTELNKVVRAHYPVVMDCGKFLNKLLPLLEYREREDWLKLIKRWKYDMPFEYKNDGFLHSEDVIRAINKQINHDRTIVTTGVGNHQMLAAQHITWVKPNSFISSGSLGTMGFGLPAAIGVKLANPDMTVIDIDGDSSFLMTMSDLKTIAEHNLDVKIVVINNNAQAMATTWEKLFYNGRLTASLHTRNPSFTAIADAFHIHSLHCDSLSTLDWTVSRMLNHKGPFLCEFKVDNTECLPLVSPGKALDDIILYKNYKGTLDTDVSLTPG